MRVPALILAILAVLPVLASAQPARPNVLIILADDMGYSDIGCYGGEIATPNIDRLAQGGLRFTQFYNTARCWPTRGSILTGYYAQQIRRDGFGGRGGGNRGVRPGWAPLLSSTLRPLGYRSYHSGKWHIDGQPMQNGFDRSYSVDDHDRFFAPKRHTEDDQPLPPVPEGTDFYLTSHIASHAIKCLQEHAQKHASQPFFGYVAFTSPHFPLHAPAADIARYRDTYTRGWDVMRDERWQRMRKLGIGGNVLSPVERDVGPPYAFPESIEKLGPNEVNRPVPWATLNSGQREFQATKMAIHAAMIDRMDRDIGRILDQLRAMGALENTIVLFLSDNGASAEMMVRGDGHDPTRPPGSSGTYLSIGPGWSTVANTPFRRHKTWVHEGGIATPLVVHWPQGIKARGELRHTPGHLVDVVPTVMELATGKPFQLERGADAPRYPGKSLTPLFGRDGAVKSDTIWFQHEGNRALRAGDWKIVAAGAEAPGELYNLAEDRAETRNLAAGQPRKLQELVERWEQEMKEYRKWAEKDAPPPLPAKARKRKA